jgi:hypothetical protein
MIFFPKMCLCQKYGELEIKNAFQSKWGLSYKTFFGSEIELYVGDSAMSLPRVESRNRHHLYSLPSL